MRRAAAVDGNQAAIVRALRQVGASVQPLNMVGDGCPDLLVGFRLLNFILELKDPDQAPNKRRLLPSQEEWHRNWRGLPPAVALTAEDALAAIGVVIA